MDIRKIDKNFDTSFTRPDDLEWFSIREFPFSIHGVAYSEEGLYRRLDKTVAEATNEGVAVLSKTTSGGRVRFATDSPYIVVRLEEPFSVPTSQMTFAARFGVSMFANGVFEGSVMPTYEQIVAADPSHGGNGKLMFDGIRRPYMESPEVYEAEICFPISNTVTAMHIGLKKGCALQAAKPYRHETPVLFYGSSITQGSCAGKPGDDYISRLSRMLDTDFINLGFSGNAKAEPAIADYIASQNPSVFVLDYDYNAPDAAYLKQTHYALYETVRRAHPITPIIFMTMPTFEGYQTRPWFRERREVILESVTRAKATGDENLYFVDCYGIFGELHNGECGTVDTCHPDSLGFFRMAERLYPLLDALLNQK